MFLCFANNRNRKQYAKLAIFRRKMIKNRLKVLKSITNMLMTDKMSKYHHIKKLT